MKTQQAKQERVIEREVRSLLIQLKKDIGDDYRASEDPDDDKPGMCVTISTDDMSSWNYQTGNNSYSGSCYGQRHWAIVYLYRNSNCTELAKDAVNELGELMATA
jgi:hypothetical protein